MRQKKRLVVKIRVTNQQEIIRRRLGSTPCCCVFWASCLPRCCYRGFINRKIARKIARKLTEKGIQNEWQLVNGEIVIQVRRMIKIGQIVARTFLENKVKQDLDQNGIEADVIVKREDIVARVKVERLLSKNDVARVNP